MASADRYAIVGLGVTRQGKVPGISSRKFMAEATRLAIEDAGLKREDIDGFIYQQYPTGPMEDAVPRVLGLPVSLYWGMAVGGCTCIAALSAAIGAIRMGMAKNVVVAYGSNAASVATSPLKRNRPFAAAYPNMASAYGQAGPAIKFAMMARSHMARYGTTSRQLGAITVAQRQWAAINPEANFYNKPITIEDHQNSRMVVDPLRLLDCSAITDGGAAFIVSSADRARDLKRPPVYVNGVGMGCFLKTIAQGRNKDTLVTTDAGTAKEQAFRMAGVELKDIDVFQIYDAFTVVVLLQLEDYGFCQKGEGGPFVASGNVIAPGTRMPMNTAGGHLAWSYLEGWTPVVEGIRQIRGECGVRQVENAELCMVTGMGGNITMSHGPGHPQVLNNACAILARS